MSMVNNTFSEGVNQNLLESGKGQYQLLKEKSNLPHYGNCWKQGVEHLEKGCQSLTEDKQSELALHFTNCFLKMSGHDTYNCESDKKRNLRAICINTMSDRAFNVYTEFYTHIQNICSFLQGHIWHEMISENTITVGLKLKETAQSQEDLLQAQKESIQLQEKMLQHGRVLENVLDDLFLSFKTHEDILNVLFQTMSNLQSWIVGEMYWFDSIIFYTAFVIVAFIMTSSQRTSTARLFIFIVLLINFLIERSICTLYTYFSNEEASTMYSNLHNHIWLIRYAFMVLTIILLAYLAFNQIDPLRKQHEILYLIQEQNSAILDILKTSINSDVCLNNFNRAIKSVDESKIDKDLSNIQQDYYILNESMQDSNKSEMLDVKDVSNDINLKVKKNKLNLLGKYNLRSSRSRSNSTNK